MQPTLARGKVGAMPSSTLEAMWEVHLPCGRSHGQSSVAGPGVLTLLALPTTSLPEAPSLGACCRVSTPV